MRQGVVVCEWRRTRCKQASVAVDEESTAKAIGCGPPAESPSTEPGSPATWARSGPCSVGDRLAALVRDVQTMQQLRRVAERYGALPRDSPIAEELVFDVIEDVLSGDAKCDAESKLAPQLWRHVVRHACRYRNAAWAGSKERPTPRLVPLDKAPADALSVDAPQRLLDEPRHEPPDPATLVAEWVACVREQARDEPAVHQLLEN